MNAAKSFPSRGWMVDINSGTEFDFPMNPAQLEESINVTWKKQRVVGMSHPIQQYVGTGAHMLPGVEFYVDSFQMAQETGIDIGPYEFLPFKRILQSLTVPPRGAQNVAGGAPSRALFVWPDVISLLVVIENVTFRYERFGQNGSPLAYRARVDFSEIRDTRYTSEEVISVGSRRRI